jgi:hypothetical protein
LVYFAVSFSREGSQGKVQFAVKRGGVSDIRYHRTCAVYSGVIPASGVVEKTCLGMAKYITMQQTHTGPHYPVCQIEVMGSLLGGCMDRKCFMRMT